MTVLVTGGAGYIGTHTCVELLNRGYDVVIIDNLVNSSIKAFDRIEQITGKKVTFYQETLARLADTYYASSFRGQMGSEAYTDQLRQWLNSQTGGLLEQQVQQQTLTEDTVFAIASTIYFSAGWQSEFREGNTHEAVFHCADKDLITTFMEQTYLGNYYYGDNFEAAYVTLTGNNNMWLILPDEGKTPADLLADKGCRYSEPFRSIGLPYNLHRILPSAADGS